jgi:membrane protease YdiL (CAAX protease family)
VTNRRLVGEAFLVLAALLALTKALEAFRSIYVIRELKPLVFAISFVYVPIFVLHHERIRPDFLDRDIRGYVTSFIAFLVAAVIVFPPFFLAAHVWQVVVVGLQGPHLTLPPSAASLLLYNMVMIAFPEEFLFRGYLQSILNSAFPKKWQVFGAQIGPSWPITAAVFAVSHSIISFEWWHFAIFFPALLFGYLRERTGSITASILFHGLSNFVMEVIGASYS